MLNSVLVAIFLAFIIGMPGALIFPNYLLSLPSWCRVTIPASVFLGAMLLNVLLDPTIRQSREGTGQVVISIVFVLLLAGGILGMILGLFRFYIRRTGRDQRDNELSSDWPLLIVIILIPCIIGLASGFAVGSNGTWWLAMVCGGAAWIGSVTHASFVASYVSSRRHNESEMKSRTGALLSVPLFLIGFGLAALGGMMAELMHREPLILSIGATTSIVSGFVVYILGQHPQLIVGATILTYQGHSGTVTAAAWCTYGQQHIASASVDHTVQVWDITSGEMSLTYRGHSSLVSAVTWLPDNSRIASASADQTVRVWDASSGKTLLPYHRHFGPVNTLSCSPDGRYIVSGGIDRTAQVWDATSGDTRLTYRGHTGTVKTLAWSPLMSAARMPSRSQHIASAGADHIVNVWRAT